jgi:hypothetical protein
MKSKTKQPKPKTEARKMVLVAIPIDLYQDFSSSKLRKQSTTDTAAILTAIRETIKIDCNCQDKSGVRI